MRYIDADHFLKSLNSVVEKNGSEVWRKIAVTMSYMVEAEATLCGKDIVACGECKHARPTGGTPYMGMFCDALCEDGNYDMGRYVQEDEFCSMGERE